VVAAWPVADIVSAARTAVMRPCRRAIVPSSDARRGAMRDGGVYAGRRARRTPEGTHFRRILRVFLATVRVTPIPGDAPPIRVASRGNGRHRRQPKTSPRTR